MSAALMDVKKLNLAFLPGSGRMGYALARLHAKNGFKVTIASRTADRAQNAAKQLKAELPPELAGGVVAASSLAEAAEAADVVFWIMGPTGSQCKSVADLEPRFDLLRQLRPQLEGKLIVDATNVMYAMDDSMWGKTSSLLMGQEALGVPARWTCAWKSIFFKRVMGDPAPDPANPMSVLICGDDADAKKIIISITDQLPGFKGLDAGSANHSRILELLGPKWLQELEAWNFPTKYEAGWRYGP